MPVSQNIGVETVKSEISKMEENAYCHQALPKINDSPAMRGGEGGGDFTMERKRRVAGPSNPSASK
jgi:hypothetical protein